MAELLRFFCYSSYFVYYFDAQRFNALLLVYAYVALVMLGKASEYCTM